MTRAALAVLAASVLAMGAPLRGQDAGEGGTIEGTVTLSDKPAPKPTRPGRYPGAKPAGEYLRGPAVVFLDGAPAAVAQPNETATMKQSNRQFDPLALPVLKGATVSFPNMDDEYHNIFSRSKAKELELGRYGKDDSRSQLFDTPGLVRLRCEIHSHMHAVIVVLENRFFAVTDAQGKFAIKNVPPGKYQLYAFHEDHEPKDPKPDVLRVFGKPVEVTKGGTVRADFDLK
jgi:plastocyanin